MRMPDRAKKALWTGQSLVARVWSSRVPKKRLLPRLSEFERKCVEVSRLEGLLVYRGSSFRISLWAAWSRPMSQC